MYFFYDTVIGEVRALTFTSGRTWPGVAPLLLLCASLMAVATIGRVLLNANGGWVSRAGSVAGSRFRRTLTGPLLSWMVALVLTGLFATLLVQRERLSTSPGTTGAAPFQQGDRGQRAYGQGNRVTFNPAAVWKVPSSRAARSPPAPLPRRRRRQR